MRCEAAVGDAAYWRADSVNVRSGLLMNSLLARCSRVAFGPRHRDVDVEPDVVIESTIVTAARTRPCVATPRAAPRCLNRMLP